MEIQSNLGQSIAPEQILGYLRKSDYLNTKYTGPDWFTLGWHRFAAAAASEFDEFLREVTSEWKWYSTKPKFDRNKALFELVDWFLFTASAIHCTNIINGLDGADIELESFHGHVTYTGMMNRGLPLMERLLVAESECRVATFIKGLGIAGSIKTVCVFLDLALELIGATPANFDEAYQFKYQTNLNRVAGGILTGGAYRKEDEVYPEILA